MINEIDDINNLVDKYIALNIIIPILKNSLGWKDKLPTPSHEVEPFLVIPTPGINTSINNIYETINNI